MTYKILKANGEYVYITTIHLFKQRELASSEHKKMRNNFDVSVAEALGYSATIFEFDYKEYTYLTPDIEYYDNFDQDGAKGSPEDSPSLPATSEFNDQYLNVDLMLP